MNYSEKSKLLIRKMLFSDEFFFSIRKQNKICLKSSLQSPFPGLTQTVLDHENSKNLYAISYQNQPNNYTLFGIKPSENLPPF